MAPVANRPEAVPKFSFFLLAGGWQPPCGLRRAGVAGERRTGIKCPCYPGRAR